MRLQPVALSLALLIVGTACSGAVSSPSGQTNPNPSATAAPPSTATAASSLGATPTTFVGGIADPPGPPPLDLETAIVTTADVYFDTFGSGALPLDRATEGDILRMRDAIPPIHVPAYEDARDADWLVDDDIVIGYVDATRTPWAYPIRILNFHEIVNDELGGIPVLIFYCPLCRSGVVFDRRVEGTTLTFGNTSALYENDLVMYDHQTGSYWWQVPGRAIVGALSGAELPAFDGVGVSGPMTGARLIAVPSRTTFWFAYIGAFPDAMVVSLPEAAG